MSSINDYHHGDLRNTFIALGVKVLQRDGVSGLTLRKVAREAGVSHTAPYRHFKDKEGLLAEIAVAGFAQLEATIQASASTDCASPAEMLRLAGLTYVDFVQTHPAHVQIMFGPIDYSAYPQLNEASHRAFSELIGFIEKAQTQGYLTPRPPAEIALTFWALLHGLAMILVTEKLPPIYEQMWDTLVEQAVAMLCEGIAVAA